MSGNVNRSVRQTKFRRALLFLFAAVLLLSLAGTAGYHFFTGWRARDLAAKAKSNFESGNYRMAWLQVNSAKELCGEDTEVLRVLGMIEGAMGRTGALDYYAKLAAKSDITPDDLKARAEIAMRFGDETQFATAISDLEKAGLPSEAGALRTARKLRQGDMNRAIAEARVAARASDDPAQRLVLARLLGQRYRPELGRGKSPSSEAIAAAAEVVELIDGLIETPLRGEALAFALNEVDTTPTNRRRWAATAMDKIEADNPALLPAATVLAQSGQKTPKQIHEQLRPIFDAAPLDRRAAYALWLTAAGMPKEALTLITAQEARESTAVFGARTEALFALDNFDAVLAAVEAGGNVDADVRLAAKARAEHARGRDAGSAQALREAMDAAAKNGRIEFLLPAGDALDGSKVVDEKLAELCNNPAVADHVFRVARDRFTRRGQFALLSASLKATKQASPESASAGDYERYLALLDGAADVSQDITLAACETEPANVTFRITHALNLLRHKQPAAALKAFDDITVFADRLPPGQLAVIAAVLAANGEVSRAIAAASSINPDLLAPGEYALILPLRSAPANRQ